jgi:hypothetical protein
MKKSCQSRSGFDLRNHNCMEAPMINAILILLLLVPAGLHAGKVKTFGGQEVDKKEAAKLTLIKSKGSKGVDHFYYVWVSDIDSVDLIDYFKIPDDVLPIKTQKDARALAHFMRCLSIGWPVYPSKELWLSPGHHFITVRAVGRFGADFNQRLDLPITPLAMKFDAEGGHEYSLNPEYEGEYWDISVNDRTADSVVAKARLSMPGGPASPDSAGRGK